MNAWQKCLCENWGWQTIKSQNHVRTLVCKKFSRLCVLRLCKMMLSSEFRYLDSVQIIVTPKKMYSKVILMPSLSILCFLTVHNFSFYFRFYINVVLAKELKKFYIWRQKSMIRTLLILKRLQSSNDCYNNYCSEPSAISHRLTAYHCHTWQMKLQTNTRRNFVASCRSSKERACRDACKNKHSIGMYAEMWRRQVTKKQNYIIIRVMWKFKWNSRRNSIAKYKSSE